MKVAVLTFTKSAYRLGETVSGVIEINERTSRSRVLKVRKITETHTQELTTSPTSSPQFLNRTNPSRHPFLLHQVPATSEGHTLNFMHRSH